MAITKKNNGSMTIIDESDFNKLKEYYEKYRQ
jgi:PHD/YefM family antitoxin component YafN of YafNO toxin-antitoxin module